MRDVLVLLLFGLGAIATLKRPFIGGLLWVWIGLMNPHRLGWGFAYDLPLAAAAAALTLLGMMFNRDQTQWPKGAPVILLVVLTLWMGITTMFSFNVDYSVGRLIAFSKMAFMTVVIGMLLKEKEHILGFIWAIVLSIGFYGIKGGLFTIASGGSYRVWGPPESVVEGNNELAVALVMIVPFMFFLAQESSWAARLPAVRRIGEKWIKRGLYVGMFLCAVSALGSYSRGALLAISAMGIMLWWRSKSKLGIAIAAIVFAGIVAAVAPEHWFARMDTIRTYDQDESAMGRITAWETAFRVANDRITGAGFSFASAEVYALYAPSGAPILVAHSNYFQMLGEHGYPGLFLFLAIFLISYLNAGYIARASKGVPELHWAETFGNMAKVSLVGYAVGGAFLNLANWDMPYYLMIVLVAGRMVVERENAKIKHAQSHSPGGRNVTNALHAGGIKR
jgi:probable O-glycosylation ligase (exosortase A-associated)